MAKVAVQHACTECGYAAARWFGRCPGCGAFGTLVEEAPPGAGGAPGREPRPILRLDVDEPEDGPGLARPAGRRGRRLFHERPEGAAAGAAPEPARRRVAALGARVLDRDLRHAVECRRASGRRLRRLCADPSRGRRFRAPARRGEQEAGEHAGDADELKRRRRLAEDRGREEDRQDGLEGQ